MGVNGLGVVLAVLDGVLGSFREVSPGVDINATETARPHGRTSGEGICPSVTSSPAWTTMEVKRKLRSCRLMKSAGA